MNEQTTQTYRERILAVQLYIQEHLDESLTIEVLARIAHFSPYHFHRIFQAMLGESVREYVRRIRLSSAAIALRTTNQGILQVALQAGYNTHESFTRAFQNWAGVSPSEYRNSGTRLIPIDRSRDMSMAQDTIPVRMERLPNLKVAFMRHIGPYQEVGPTFRKFMQWASEHRLFPSGMQSPIPSNIMILGICHDDPEVTPADKLRYDCGITVNDDFEAEGEVGVQTIPGGDFAVGTLIGPCDQLGAVYRWMYGVWLPQQARELRNQPPFEVFRTSMKDTPPEKMHTEVFLPLQSRE